MGRRDLAGLARIVHEREYADGEYISEEGRPGAALFIVRRGVEVVRRDADTREIPIVLLEPPASFDESAAIGTGVIRWFSVRASGPVSLLALGRSDLDAFVIWVVVAVVLAELLKNVVYEPIVLGGAVKLHPLVVVMGVVGGAILFGPAGMFLAIPTITVVRVLVASGARHLMAYGVI